MMKEKFIDQLVQFIFGEITKKIGKKIEQTRIEKRITDVINRIDNDLLSKFGNQTIYQHISKILFIDNKISVIINRVYSINDFEFNSDKEFAHKILNEYELSPYMKEDITKLILDLTTNLFLEFNEDISDEGRVIVKTLQKSLTSNQSELLKNNNDIQFYREIIEALIKPQSDKNINQVYLLFSEEYNYVLEQKNMDSKFALSISVFPYYDEDKFNSFNDYINQSKSSNVEIDLRVALVQLWENDKFIRNLYIAKDTAGMIKFGVFKTSSMSSDFVETLRTLEELSIKLSPVKKYVYLDIETFDSKVLLNNVTFEITKKVIDNSTIEYNFTSTGDNESSIITMKYLIEERSSKLIKSSFTSTPKSKDSANAILRHLINTNEIIISGGMIIRDSEHKQLLTKAKDIIINSDYNIQKGIEFFKKVVFIQDYYKLKFALTPQIYESDYASANCLYELLTEGVCLFEEDPFDLEFFDEELITKNHLENESFLKVGEAKVEYIVVFNQKIDMKGEMKKIFYNATYEKKQGSVYTVKNNHKTVIVYTPIFGTEITKEKIEKLLEI